VVVDKPMATTLAEADEMVAAARRTGRMLTVFHNRRWDPDFQMLKAVVARDILGSVLTLDSRIYMADGLWGVWGTHGTPEFRPGWRLEAAFGGGYLADWGPHMVDQCLNLVGEWPVSVSCQLRSDLWSDEVDDYYSMRVVFPSGVIATLEASNNARIAPPRWYVVGRQGTLVARGEFSAWTEMRIRADIDGIVAELKPAELGSAASPRRYNSGAETSDYYYSDLAEAIETGRGPTISADHARNVMVVLDAARRSDAAGETVYLQD
jgi:predicted dehydrogenase